MTESPLFSVIIPTRDRPSRLAACLEALSAIDFPADRFEVVVSDDGSRVLPTAVTDRFVRRIQIRLVHGANGGPAAARNRGAAQARGRYLVFTDDDCLPDPGWLAAFERRFTDAPDQLVAGGILNGLPDNPFSTATQLIVSYAYDRNDARAAATRLYNTCNLAVPAEQFHRIGGFSELFPTAAGEDYDFCARWQHAGLRTAYASEAVVRHVHPLTFAGFCRQHFNYGRGLYLCRRRIAERERTTLRIERPGFYLGLVRYPLQQVRGPAGLLYGILVVISQAATVAGAVREAVASRPSKPKSYIPPHADQSG